jgi:hypothetical protein
LSSPTNAIAMTLAALEAKMHLLEFVTKD